MRGVGSGGCWPRRWLLGAVLAVPTIFSLTVQMQSAPVAQPVSFSSLAGDPIMWFCALTLMFWVTVPPPLTLLLMLMPEPLLVTVLPARTTVGNSAKPTMMAKRDAIRMWVLPVSSWQLRHVVIEDGVNGA